MLHGLAPTDVLARTWKVYTVSGIKFADTPQLMSWPWQRRMLADCVCGIPFTCGTIRISYPVTVTWAYALGAVQ